MICARRFLGVLATVRDVRRTTGDAMAHLSCFPTRWLLGITVLACLMLSGCSGAWLEMEEFGAVTSPEQYYSLNGMGVHRKMWESVGARCYTPARLSPRLDDFDVIVLIGRTFEPPGKEAREWLQRWLHARPGRTIVYFGRDFDSDMHYRQRTLDQLDPEDLPRGEQHLALEQAELMRRRVSEMPHDAFAGWFFIDTQSRPRDFDAFHGTDRFAEDLPSGTWRVGLTLRPPAAEQAERLPSNLQQLGAATSSGGRGNLAPAASAAQGKPPDEEAPGSVRTSVWSPEEWSTTEQWEAAFDSLLESDVLLSSRDGTPLIFRLRDSQHRVDSQILVVQNGAPLLNGSLVEPLHREIGQRLIETCLPAERVALVPYDWRGLPLSDVPEKDLRGAGLEMLTVWPLSAITMTAALLGVIVCAVLLPILGRPQPQRARSISDFGLHVEAIGEMLHETRDADYARTMIREYFEQVKGEPPPEWLGSRPPAEVKRSSEGA